MNHWQLLELTPDADERSIKRAYARLLKVHRPDEDPAAFQRLREAYEASLAEARWRAQDDEEALARALAEHELEEQSAAQAAPLSPADHEQTLFAASPPQPSLAVMQQWLAEGKEPQVLEALGHWLVSDWLLPFERRQQFEQQVLQWLESAPQWSLAFFERVCQAMGWDEILGELPCEYWRWDALIDRCERQAVEERVRADLARFDDDGWRGQVAALLFKPLSDRRRRKIADGFSSLDWQRFSELAESLEHQNRELPERLGLKPLDSWRQWMPPSSFQGVYLFLWFALGALVVYSLLEYPKRIHGLAATLAIPLFIPGAIYLGSTVYRLWSMLAVSAGAYDILLSRLLIPRRWYRQGAGLLLLRHIVPSLVPAIYAWVWSSNVPGLRWVGPLLVYLGTLYFTNMTLSGGKVPIWDRALQAIKRQVARLPWGRLRQGALICLAVVAMGVYVYLHTGIMG